MLPKAALLLILTTTFLMGCAVQQTNLVAGIPRPAGLTAGKRVISKTVPSGKTMVIEGLTSINPDCTSAGIGTLRIIRQPEHGTAKVTRRDGYSTYPQGNPRSACNKTKHPGIYVDYTPVDDFIGNDLMIIEIITTDGVDVEEKIVITVK